MGWGSQTGSKSAQNNTANQWNPNHKKTGEGRDAGYNGSRTKNDLNNHANQCNSNNKEYNNSRSQWGSSSSSNNNSNKNCYFGSNYHSF